MELQQIQEAATQARTPDEAKVVLTAIHQRLGEHPDEIELRDLAEEMQMTIAAGERRRR